MDAKITPDREVVSSATLVPRPSEQDLNASPTFSLQPKDFGSSSEKELMGVFGTTDGGINTSVVGDTANEFIDDTTGPAVVNPPRPPKPDTTPENPLDKDYLQQLIDQLLGSLLGGSSPDFSAAATSIGQFLKEWQTYFDKFKGVSPGDALNLAQSVYNTISTYMTSYLNMLYDRQNWVFQQEYNNPINQIRRFMTAGINPAFYFGSLGNSNAGAIGDAQMQGGNLGAQISSVNPAVEFASRAVGVIGNLVGIGQGTANTFSNWNYNRAQIDNIKSLTPAQLTSLYSGAFAQQQQGEFNKANIGYQKVLTDCASEQLQVSWANILNAYAIAQLDADTSVETANISANATRDASMIGARATTDSARIAASSNEQSNRLNGYKALIDQYYEEVTELGWVEDSTGDIVTSENSEYGDITASAELSGGLNLGPLGTLPSFKGSSSSTSGQSLKEGVTTTYGNKKYTSKQVTYGRIKDYKKFMQAIKAVDGLVKTGSNDPAFNHYMSKGMRVIDKQQRRAFKHVASDFAKWILGYDSSK